MEWRGDGCQALATHPPSKIVQFSLPNATRRAAYWSQLTNLWPRSLRSNMVSPNHRGKSKKSAATIEQPHVNSRNAKNSSHEQPGVRSTPACQYPCDG